MPRRTPSCASWQPSCTSSNDPWKLRINVRKEEYLQLPGSRKVKIYFVLSQLMQDHLRLDPIFPFSCCGIEGKPLSPFGREGKIKSSGPKMYGFRKLLLRRGQKKRALLVFESRGLMWDCDVWRRGRCITEEKRQKRREK